MEASSSTAISPPGVAAVAAPRQFPIHPRIVSIVALPAIWFVITLFTPKFAFPTPIAVAETMWEVAANGTLWPHAAGTLWRVLVALAGGMLVGLIIGLLMGINRYWERFFRNWVFMGLSMPGLIWAMVTSMWFGINVISVLITIVLVVFPYVSVNIFEGVKNVEKSLVDMGRAYQLPRERIIRHIILPSLVPFVLAAVRQAFASCWKVAAIAEVFGATTGIGYMLRSHFEFYDMAGVFAWTFWFAIVIIGLEYGIIVPVQRRLLSWRPEIGEVL